MASREAVRQYLACWFQAGKSVVYGQETWRPQRVTQVGQYSPEFISLWQEMVQRGLHYYSLAGTDVSLGQLCSDDWEIMACSRCTMPIPIKIAGMTTGSCPCADLALWPNPNLPLPHGVVDSQAHLAQVQARLQQ
ncbi:hypothetical protein GlitD10_0553 [Gloeomargarita lithophora Alchichica-D10]|uniref:Uncharacterized protein n=1 Tax=Gloeomargarita lithophora Alchichica-D10 TaxID=1188229 RepID=A0A1J0AAB0_9CYAN|nr:hypothetical protein [Gloeomargarita lithophora]APB32867.1 hypothetical protein GlitD10_0553 [Gloeomargarita lithophora Alchichica-D10]